MPNFHTHWLVALQVLDALPKPFAYLRAGRREYVARARTLGDELRTHVRGILERADLDAAAGLQATIGEKVEDWETTLRGDENAICFSAYLLGACGPDFWMLPGDNVTGTVPDFASRHFDLGHYNRSHLQFLVSLERLGPRDDFQARVEKAYFLGMATHLAADLVLHQLVNVSAGAYNLLKLDAAPFHGTWSNEQGFEWLTPGGPATEGNAAQRAVHHVGEGTAKVAGDAAWIWTTHNKVEHYWDTWVRYRWLGDFGPVWPDESASGQLPVLGLPLCDTLRRDLLGRLGTVAGLGNTVAHRASDAARAAVRILPGRHEANRRAAVIDRVDYALGSVETRWLLEKPLAFPWLFCDAVLRGDARPFIYDRVVDKDVGAYPGDLLFEQATKEATEPQMNEPAPAVARGKKAARAPSPAPGGGRSEKRKLQFFSTERNATMALSSWNYLNYLTCPNHERLIRFGRDVFYDRAAFAPFMARGAELAATFTGELGSAYAAAKPALGKLGRFWNLDTGLGLQIENVASPERHQVITRIHWVHALGPAGIAAAVDYDGLAAAPAYTGHMEKAAGEPYPLRAWKDAQRAFTTYEAGPFENLGAVVEDEAVVQERRYLRRLRLEHPLAAGRSAPIFQRLSRKEAHETDEAFEEALFAEDDAGAAARHDRVPTGKTVTARAYRVDHRLDLEVRASIAKLGAPAGDVAMYLLGDAAGDVQPPESEDREAEAATKWLRGRSQILDRVLEPERDRAAEKAGLATFSARILLNLSEDKTDAKARVVAPAGKWNNVVPLATHGGHYGRNFAVATARRYVLRGQNEKPPFNFDPTADFTYLPDLGLTEHCFFTVFPLVKTARGWIDAFSKQPVTADDLKVMKKVDAINFVKIILLYVLDRGAVQLRWCYVDGVRTEVLPAAS